MYMGIWPLIIYACTEVSVNVSSQIMGRRLGFDWLACLIGDVFEFCIILILPNITQEEGIGVTLAINSA